MAPRGRKPVPTNLRVLENRTGTKVRDRSAAARKRGAKGEMVVPETVDVIPPPPSVLKEGGRGAEYWQVYWEHAVTWLTWADIPMVTRLCELWDMYEDIKQGILIQGEGHMYIESRRRGTTGKNVGHPMMAALRETASLMEKLEGNLGLSPVERSRIRLEKGEKGSPLDEWQRKRDARQATQ